MRSGCKQDFFKGKLSSTYKLVVLKKVTEIENKAEKETEFPLNYALCTCGESKGIKTLINKGEDFSKTNLFGSFPLLSAISNGKREAANVLLENPFAIIGDVNRTNLTGITSLYWAIYHDFSEIVEKLIEKGAKTSFEKKQKIMPLIHYCCYHNRPNCLYILSKYVDKKSYEMSEEGSNALHVALEHSLQCTEFLLSKKKNNLNELDSRNLTPQDLAVINGQYELALELPNKGKMKYYLNVEESDTRKNNLDEFDQLNKALSSRNISESNRLAEILSKKFKGKQISNKQKELLVKNSCIGRCEDFVELLSTIFELSEYPIAIDSARYGLVDWIQQIDKYGGDLLVEKNGQTIFDIAVENTDSIYLKKAFEFIEHIPIHIINRIVVRSIEINNDLTMKVISEALDSNKNCNYFLNPSLILIPSLSVNAFSIYKKNIDSKIHIDLSECVLNVSPKIILRLLDMYQFSKNELKLACIKSLKSGNNDNAFIIIEQNPFLLNEINENQKIKNLTDENKRKAKKSILSLISDNTSSENKKVNYFK